MTGAIGVVGAVGCSSDEPLMKRDAVGGFDVTCTMTDLAPGNGDRPYVEMALNGCEWERRDHDDGERPVVDSSHLDACGEPPDKLRWRVCQTHGGPLPDDCASGSVGIPGDDVEV